MPRKAFNREAIEALGVTKLAQIVLDEAERSAPFRKLVKAALASLEGPEKVAKLVDRRLAGLKRAKSFVDWDKTRAFATDLQALVDMIERELAPLSPQIAADRLLRFIQTHEQVFDRIDDSSGRVQDVYYAAIAVLGEVAQSLSGHGIDLPGRIMSALGESSHGYLIDATEAVVPHLPIDVLQRWDVDLAEAITKREAEERDAARQGWHYSMASQWRTMRRILAAACDDLDLLIQLETDQPTHMRDALGLAERLLEAGRFEEALHWVRQAETRRGSPDGPSCDPRKISIEARILFEQGEKDAALDLLWQAYKDDLNTDHLRAHLKALADFEDIDREAQAMEIALAYPDRLKALSFLMDWPKHDLAASIVITHHSQWQGSDWHILPKIAEILQHEYALAATILYRALLDDILTKARSKAYRYGAGYFSMLGQIADMAQADPAWPNDMPQHHVYTANLKEKHKRKTGFWSLIDGR